MKLIEVYPNSCTGCRACEMVCSLLHEQACSANRSRIRILRDDEFGNHAISVCMQCADAPCVRSCPVEALSRDERTGAILVNQELCNGCEACVAVCPLDAIRVDRERNTAFVCDLCGGDPECVKMCQRKALLLNEVALALPARKSSIEETAKLLLKTQEINKISR